jgi:uncharacterized cofD-like protein
MSIKAIIFDLDDTLYDCSNTLTEGAQARAVEAMIAHGLNASVGEAMQAIPALREAQQGKLNIVEALVERFGPQRDHLIAVGQQAYNRDEIEDGIELFPDVSRTLMSLREKYKLILVTTGVAQRQRNKISKLGLDNSFDLILIDDVNEKLSKKERFLAAMTNYGLQPNDVLVVGDRVFSEIKIGNQLGMITVHMKQGHYANIAPSKEWESPDYTIFQISEIPFIIQNIDQEQIPRIVLLGGGTGLPSLLSGLRLHRCELTAVVSVTDSGRSSGTLRREFGMAPPGDIRNCLAALAAGNLRLAELLQYRFDTGGLEGHTLGNLLLVALTKMNGSFGAAVEELSQILSTKGKVLPASLDILHIEAELEDGTRLKSEDAIVTEGDIPLHKRSPIVSVNLNQEASVYPPVVAAIREADAIVLGPGGLFTSVISSLLVPGIREAIEKSRAKVIYICNVVTQPGQTQGYTVSDHVQHLNDALGKRHVDQVIVHAKKVAKHLRKAMAHVHSEVIECDTARLREMGVDLIQADVIEDLADIPDLWKKTHLLRHDPEKLARQVIACLQAFSAK